MRRSPRSRGSFSVAIASAGTQRIAAGVVGFAVFLVRSCSSRSRRSIAPRRSWAVGNPSRPARPRPKASSACRPREPRRARRSTDGSSSTSGAVNSPFTAVWVYADGRLIPGDMGGFPAGARPGGPPVSSSNTSPPRGSSSCGPRSSRPGSSTTTLRSCADHPASSRNPGVQRRTTRAADVGRAGELPRPEGRAVGDAGAGERPGRDLCAHRRPDDVAGERMGGPGSSRPTCPRGTRCGSGSSPVLGGRTCPSEHVSGRSCRHRRWTSSVSARS